MKTNRYAIYLVAALAGLAGIAVSGNGLGNRFVNWDDVAYVLNNPFIRSFDAIFVKKAFLGFYANNWHPLTWLSHAADYHIWGLGPKGHHLTSIVLHGLNTFLVTVLTVRLVHIAEPSTVSDSRRLVAGGVAGLLFGIHPLHVESVAWVSERKDLLCAFFFLLSVIAYLRHGSNIRENGAGAVKHMGGYYGGALAFFFCALLSKPMAVSLPLVLLIIDWYPLRRIGAGRNRGTVLLEKLPFLALSFGASAMTFMAQKEGGALVPMEAISLPVRLMVAVKALVLYLGKMIVPVNLTPFYPYPKHPAPFMIVASAAFVAAITAACLVAARKRPFLQAAWVYYVVTLIPVLGIVQVGNQAMADRYTYLPGIGPFIVVGVTVAWAVWAFSRMVAVATGGGVFLAVAVFGTLTWKQTAVWHDSISLWSHVIESNRAEEDNAVKYSFVYNNRGVAFHERHDLDRAIADYGRAIALDPMDDACYKNRAAAYIATKRYAEALADNEKAFALNRLNSGALYNIACIRALQGDAGEACRWLRKSVEQGYADWDQIRHDPDLDSIRSTDCYQSLMTGK